MKPLTFKIKYNKYMYAKILKRKNHMRMLRLTQFLEIFLK